MAPKSCKATLSLRKNLSGEFFNFILLEEGGAQEVKAQMDYNVVCEA